MMNNVEDRYKNRQEHEMHVEEHYTLTEKFIRKDYFFPLHWHNFYEIEIILSGQGEHVLNSEKQTLKRGSAVLLTHLDNHSIGATEDMFVISLRLDFAVIPESITNHMMWKNGFLCQLKEDELDNIEYCVKKLKEADKMSPLYHTVVSNLITTIMLHIVKHSPENEAPSSSLIQNVLAYINTSYKEDISIDSVAKKFFVTPKYLGALFKKNTGNSFHHYLNMMRLKCACSLLKTTNMSVKDAALTSGYNSIEHFIYTFKKHLSVSPTAYRKNKYDFTPLISRNSK